MDLENMTPEEACEVLAELMFEFGKHELEENGIVHPAIIMKGNKKDVVIILQDWLGSRDNTMRAMASCGFAYDATLIAVLSDVWTYTAAVEEDEDPNDLRTVMERRKANPDFVLPRNHPDKEEALMVDITTNNGKQMSFMRKYTRNPIEMKEISSPTKSISSFSSFWNHLEDFEYVIRDSATKNGIKLNDIYPNTDQTILDYTREQIAKTVEKTFSIFNLEDSKWRE